MFVQEVFLLFSGQARASLIRFFSKSVFPFLFGILTTVLNIYLV